MGKIKEYKEKLSLDESVKAAIKYCIENDILRQFLREHAPEVINMLTDDITVEELANVRYREGHEDGREEIARNLIAEGSTPEFIQKITGLSPDEINNL